MSVVLLGAHGYVGSAYRAYFESRNIFCLSVSRREINYTDKAVLVRFLAQAKPLFVLCAAGYTGKPNVDACELHKSDCLAGNALLPGIIRAACEEVSVPWGHVSSGCIFTGDKGTTMQGDRTVPIGFTEEDTPNFSFRQNNCSFYSGTKALGEELLTEAPNCYIWRLRIPFNSEYNPRNYLTKVMRYERLLGATNSLSELGEFVRATWETVEKGLPHGIYNVTNPGSITTQEVVELIRRSGVCDKTFEFFKDEAEFMQIAAKTPRSNCVLDSSKLASHGVKMTEVHEAVEKALRSWKK